MKEIKEQWEYVVEGGKLVVFCKEWEKKKKKSTTDWYLKHEIVGIISLVLMFEIYNQ